MLASLSLASITLAEQTTRAEPLMNEIHYMVTVEDVAHLNHHHFRSSSRARKGAFLTVAASIGMMMISLIAFSLMLGVTPGPMVIFLAIMIILTARSYARRRPNRSFVRRVKRLFEDGRNINLFGQHHMLLHHDCLEVKTPYSQGTIRWEAIERVEQDEDYIFIYTSSLNAHIINKRHFPSPEMAQAFFALAQHLHQGALQLHTDQRQPLMLPGPYKQAEAFTGATEYPEVATFPRPQFHAPLAKQRIGQEATPEGIDGSL